MQGITSLQELLDSLSPQLMDGEYVFCTLQQGVYGDYAEANPIASFREVEGLTLVMLKSAADRLGFSYNETFKCISLGVHSSLEAVGLTAAVSSQLSKQGISANVIAAYFHDHIFVPVHLAETALQTLKELSY